MSAMDAVRIDKWLWAARFYKTRSAATEAVLGGRVHVNGERVKPAKDVHVGDRLELTIGDTRRTVVVRGVAEKRGPASVAATLYEETPESIALGSSGRPSAGSHDRSAPTSGRGRRSRTAAASRRCDAHSAGARRLTQSARSTGRR